MSASKRPTLYPALLSAIARLAETVDLPTPPLPEEIASLHFTPSSGIALGACTGVVTITSMCPLMSTSSLTNVRIARSQALIRDFENGSCGFN